jgi:hypothetical protein
VTRLGGLFLGVLACAACAAPSTPAAPRPVATKASRSPADEVLAAIDTSDLPRAFAALCAQYAAGGTPCSETVYLTFLDADDVMSRIDDKENVKMSPMPAPGGGLAYWDNWSKVLSNGSWPARDLFRDDEDARQVANMLLVTVLAHELGHHIARLYRCHPFGPAKELRADELSLSLLRGLFADARLAALHARMRSVADAMIAIVPVRPRSLVPQDVDVRAWVDAQHELPARVPSYVALHLSRQRRLLVETEPYAARVGRLCVEPFAKYLASRHVHPGQTRTQALLPDLGDDVVAVDRAGRVFVTGPFVEKGKLSIRRVDATGPALVADLPGELTIVGSFAAFSADRFAVADDQHAWLIERDPGGHVTVESKGVVPDGTELAFDAKGSLLAARRTETAWVVGALGAPATWTLRLQTDDRSGWADGPLATALGSPRKPALRDGRIVFVDQERNAVRSLGATEVTTLAGSIAGRRDGSSADARFFAISSVGVLDDGRVAVVETDHRARRSLLRFIEPR